MGFLVEESGHELEGQFKIQLRQQGSVELILQVESPRKSVSNPYQACSNNMSLQMNILYSDLIASKSKEKVIHRYWIRLENKSIRLGQDNNLLAFRLESENQPTICADIPARLTQCVEQALNQRNDPNTLAELRKTGRLKTERKTQEKVSYHHLLMTCLVFGSLAFLLKVDLWPASVVCLTGIGFFSFRSEIPTAKVGADLERKT